MNANDTMRALVQGSHRGPQDMTLSTDVRRPVPGPGEYLIKVGAAGVNFADVMQTYGTYEGGPQPHYTAGFEAAGEIVGSGRITGTPYPEGTRVIGTGLGAFAQYMTMPAQAVLPVPTGWSDAESLGLVINWATALAALKPLGEIEQGQSVLIYAAAGGVGQAAVQLARHYGAEVIAAASPDKHEAVGKLGAQTVLDSRGPDLSAQILEASRGGVDLVLESVGRATFETSLAVAKPYTGRIVVFGGSSGDATLTTRDFVFRHYSRLMGLHIATLAAKAPAIFQGLLTELDTLIKEGVYTPTPPTVHPLADGPDVLVRLGAGRTTGKHALDPWR
ncbi:zinc-binding dehydrogenase [Streptomyces sp. HUAS TT7]|uniref:zinc-binding dehydrogenase n=1 Tax=Streptomyces sp. HUAS TT7 TaxID=3447507 RepID=UPI003F65CB9D